MSHQGLVGWFPDCLVCGYGNHNAVVCLNPVCHEEHQGQVIAELWEGPVEEDGHWWKKCQLCRALIRSDPHAWGTFALCIGCWNEWAKRGDLPPFSPRLLE
jgi:hypothetical protein